MLSSKRIIDLKYVKLCRFLTKHPIQFTAPNNQINRQIHLGPPRLKWLSAEEAKKVHEVAVGSRAGHPDDPVVNTSDKPYFGNPAKGDPVMQTFYYRDPVVPRLYIDLLLTKILTSFFWFWLFYHLYYDYGMLFGHFYVPYLEEFTDEELGIPPDDAEDPEYWGNHGKPHGTYR